MAAPAASPTQTQTPPDGVILRAEQVSKFYPGTVALDHVDFNVYRGKVNVLVGENGAGKSTLMKILAGVEQPNEGRLMLEEKEIRPKSPREAEEEGIGIIYQELNLFPNLNVSENIFMAHELTQGKSVIKHRMQEVRTRALLSRLEQPIDPRTLVQNLRIGQQQIVEIAKALAFDTQILIMDEPTSALSNAEVEVLFTVIEDLKAAGVSIIYISHKLEELMQIGDVITVLRDGRLIAEAPMGKVDLPWIIERMVGRETEMVYHPPQHEFGEPILDVNHITLPKPGGGHLLEDVSFSLRAGEILGVYGLMGAGRTEMFECLMGLHPEASGEIRINDRKVRGLIDSRIAQGLMIIPEDRQREGLVQELSIADNMLLASLRRYMRSFFLSAAKENESITRLIKELSIKVSSPQHLVSSLSGGNQQKVVVAKALLTSPKILLMDEPTRGIDVGAKEEIFQIMRNLAAQGLGIIFVSTELKEIMAMADRILVMSKGRITKEFDRTEATQQALVEASAIGHELARKDNTSNGGN
ncbi:sugar ABC transporter ATP-binding protein [Aggregatilinea lenta]|uniref:sugar ABC transporter ATP-binding protein n=1 Tax=Aggregatilinea lenta TaxID=913108 RepID=UPI000E5BA1C9|nr:sugar ABC transporter ATP-binding protein [Aggregatilinea lenta]